MRHLLTIADLTPGEIEQLFAQAKLIKRDRERGAGSQSKLPLAGCTIAMLFEKPSLRTRVSFEVAATELGANCLYLSPQEVGLGTREALADVARVLSGYVHGMVLRTFQQATMEEFARHATIPVINGLSDSHHPCQGLTDVFTILEQCGNRTGITITYLGDGNNCAHSLMQAAARLGMHLRLSTPSGYEPDAVLLREAEVRARERGGSVMLVPDPRSAVERADVLYTDVWASMGTDPVQVEAREAIFAPYRLDMELLERAGPGAIVLHPLPAHRNHEITDDVIDGPQSRVFVQAENRLHVQKALLRMLVTTSLQASLSA